MIPTATALHATTNVIRLLAGSSSGSHVVPLEPICCSPALAASSRPAAISHR
jgi:hypothetical protein